MKIASSALVLALFVLSGCWWKNREVASSNSTAKAEAVRCCVCEVAYSTNLQVDGYYGKTNCEDRSGKTPFKKCKKVTVEESSCHTVLRNGDGCMANPLHYTENGKRITIPPPPDTEVNCDTSGASMADGASDESSEKPEVVTDTSSESGPSAYCTCEVDPWNESQCRVVLMQDGNPTVLETKPKKAGGTCSKDECMVLFDQEAYRSTCPTYKETPAT